MSSSTNIAGGASIPTTIQNLGANNSGALKKPDNATDALINQAANGSPLAQGQALRALDGRTGDRLATTALVNDTQSAQPDTCRIEVRFTPVAAGANHSFIVTTDGNSQNYYRGGPSAGGPSSGSSGAIGSGSGGSSSQGSGSGSSGSSNSSNSSNGSSPGSSRGGAGANNGSWGPIVTDFGAYRQGTIDWTTTPSGQQTVEVRNESCDNVERQFAQGATDIQNAQTPYNPFSSNSNATVRELLERAGITPPRPVVWAPGWDTKLP